jgi:thiol-disulfide isomerase/thioredoxin
MLKRILPVALVIAAVAAWAACSSQKAETEKKAETATADDGKEDSSVTQSHPSVISWKAVDVEGKEHSSKEWIGKQPVVINFWGTWCPPCRREIPDLVRVYQEYKNKGVEIISFAFRDTPQQVKTFASQHNMNWVLLMQPDQQMLVDYQFSGGVPTTIFLDAKGNEVGRFVGPRDYQTLKQAFESILNARS